MHTIHKPTNVDASKFSFGDIQINQYGGKSCRVKYDGEDFMFQTPRMRLPYGLGVYEEKDGDGNVIKSKYSLDFSFAGYELNDQGVPSKPKVRALFEMCKSMEKLLLVATVENSSEWLGADELNEAAAKVLTREIVKYPRDKQTKKVTDRYPPTFKAKVGFYDGKFGVNAFNDKKEPITDLASNCPKRTEAVSIIKCTGITFAGGKCGFSFRVYQIKLYLPATMPSYAFIDDEDDETPVESANVEPVKQVVTSSSTAPQLIEDSETDEEDEDEDELDLDDESEEEDEVAPLPKKVVKVKRKRKTKNKSKN